MRYLILISAILMQMCLGATYSWSVFVQPLKLLTGLQQGPVQIPFTVFYFTFPAMMIFSGIVLPRLGPRKCAIGGGLLFGGGWLLAGQGSNVFALTTLGIGFLSGIGAGMAYIVPIAVCIRWFPRNKGLVTGTAVAGFGGGAALVSQIGGWLMTEGGESPFSTFTWFGVLFLVIITLAGSFMRYPSDSILPAARAPISPRSIVSQPVFRLLYCAMFCGLAAGFAVNANLKELFQNAPGAVQTGITAVALFALANAAGRIIWGVVFDRVTATTALVLNLLFQAVVLLAAPLFLTTAKGFLLMAVCCGFNYGGILVLYVSTTSRKWGNDHVGQIYGWMFSANIPASFAPLAAGLIFDSFGNFMPAFYCLSGLLVIMSIALLRNRALIDSPQ